MVILDTIQLIINQFRAAFINVPLENVWSYLYVILNFFLQLGGGFGGGGQV